MKSDICKNGHHRTPESTYRKANGTMGCLLCQRAGQARWKKNHPEHRIVTNARRRAKTAEKLADQAPARCKCCGVEFTKIAGGHQRKYCGDTCKSLVLTSGGARRWRWLWDRYRVTKAQFESMCEAQGNACAICRAGFSGVGLEKTAPQLDHCHSAGSPRGILCRLCNTALGNFKDDPALIQRALEYLACHRDKEAAA